MYRSIGADLRSVGRIPATSARASIMASIRSNAIKAEVRARLPKQNEEKDNDDWAKFEVFIAFFDSLLDAEISIRRNQPICGKPRSP